MPITAVNSCGLSILALVKYDRTALAVPSKANSTRQLNNKQSNSRWLSQFAALNQRRALAYGRIGYANAVVGCTKMNLLFHRSVKARAMCAR